MNPILMRRQRHALHNRLIIRPNKIHMFRQPQTQLQIIAVGPLTHRCAKWRGARLDGSVCELVECNHPAPLTQRIKHIKHILPNLLDRPLVCPAEQILQARILRFIPVELGFTGNIHAGLCLRFSCCRRRRRRTRIG